MQQVQWGCMSPKSSVMQGRHWEGHLQVLSRVSQGWRGKLRWSVRQSGLLRRGSWLQEIVPQFSTLWLLQQRRHLYNNRGKQQHSVTARGITVHWENYISFSFHSEWDMIIDPFSKDLKLPWNEAGSGVPTYVIFIYSICFRHFLIDLGCCRFRPLFCTRLFTNLWNWTPHPLWGGLKPPKKSPIFKYFLIQLECWNFGCGLRPLFCIRIFSFFEIGPLSPHWDPQKECCPPKSKILHLLPDFIEIWNLTFSYVHQ